MIMIHSFQRLRLPVFFTLACCWRLHAERSERWQPCPPARQPAVLDVSWSSRNHGIFVNEPFVFETAELFRKENEEKDSKNYIKSDRNNY